MDRRLKNVAYAATAGICGSSAGTFGKIGMSVDEFYGIDDLQVRAVVYLYNLYSNSALKIHFACRSRM